MWKRSGDGLMCLSCYRRITGTEERLPETDLMRHAAALVNLIYSSEWGSGGGPLHVEMDDMNVGDERFTSERLAAFPEQWLHKIYSDLTPADWALCQDAISALAALTAAERAHVSMWMVAR